MFPHAMGKFVQGDVLLLPRDDRAVLKLVLLLGYLFDNRLLASDLLRRITELFLL